MYIIYEQTEFVNSITNPTKIEKKLVTTECAHNLTFCNCCGSSYIGKAASDPQKYLESNSLGILAYTGDKEIKESEDDLRLIKTIKTKNGNLNISILKRFL